jgi:hypothetical protein
VAGQTESDSMKRIASACIRHGRNTPHPSRPDSDSFLKTQRIGIRGRDASYFPLRKFEGSVIPRSPNTAYSPAAQREIETAGKQRR